MPFNMVSTQGSLGGLKVVPWSQNYPADIKRNNNRGEKTLNKHPEKSFQIVLPDRQGGVEGP